MPNLDFDLTQAEGLGRLNLTNLSVPSVRWSFITTAAISEAPCLSAMRAAKVSIWASWEAHEESVFMANERYSDQELGAVGLCGAAGLAFAVNAFLAHKAHCVP